MKKKQKSNKIKTKYDKRRHSMHAKLVMKENKNWEIIV
jgi:hypothetical protein